MIDNLIGVSALLSNYTNVSEFYSEIGCVLEQPNRNSYFFSDSENCLNYRIELISSENSLTSSTDLFFNSKFY